MTPSKTNPTKTPVSILCASAFIVLCSAALIIYDIVLVVASIIFPHNPIYASRLETKGFIIIVGLFLVGAFLLLKGLRSLLKRGNPTQLFVILGIPLVLGSIGEIADFISNSTVISNLIGSAILLLFAAPIVLLLLPSSRQWYSR